MKYVRPSAIVPGVKDTYQIILYTVDQLHKQISGKYMFMAVASNGTIDWTTKEFRIYNKPGGKIIDPVWDARSHPPKPKGFVFEDPSTWGGLMWEEIPMVDDIREHYYDYFMSFQSARQLVLSGDYVEEALMRTLIKTGEFPTAAEGEIPWAIA